MTNNKYAKLLKRFCIDRVNIKTTAPYLRTNSILSLVTYFLFDAVTSDSCPVSVGECFLLAMFNTTPSVFATCFSQLRANGDSGSATKMDRWPIQTPSDVPQQNNSLDCGVFACMFANYLGLRRNPDFTMQNIDLFRRKMALSFLNGQIDP